jgi:hypothetical protein
MFRFTDYETQRLRREEIQRDSDRLNRITAARQLADANARPFYAVALAHIGKMLVEVGMKLEAQYGDLVENAQYAAEAGCADNSTAAHPIG